MPDPVQTIKKIAEKIQKNIKEQDKFCESLKKASKDHPDYKIQAKTVADTLKKDRNLAFRMLNDMRRS